MNHSLPQAPKYFSDNVSDNIDLLYNLIHSYMIIHVAQRAEYRGKRKRGGRSFSSDTILNPAGLNYSNGDPHMYFVEEEPQIKSFLATLTKIFKRQFPTKKDHEKLIIKINDKAESIMYMIDKSDKANIDRLFEGIANWSVKDVQHKAMIKAVVETSGMLSTLVGRLHTDMAQLDK